MSQLKKLNSIRRRTMELKIFIQIFLSKYNSIKERIKKLCEKSKICKCKRIIFDKIDIKEYLCTLQNYLNNKIFK